MKRQSGVLLPVFSLHGKYGCGTFGKSAYEWIDTLEQGGFSCWQVLPFGMTDEHNSPYMSYSSFGGNINFVDPEALWLQKLVTKEELDSLEISDPYLCDYEALKKTRFEFFKKAARRLKDTTKIASWLSLHPDVAETCRFLALKMANGGVHWKDWSIQEPDRVDLLTWQLIQYEFHRQWDRLHQYAKIKGIKIIGDLPFYVSYDSCDVWSSPESFQLDKRNRPTAVAGVPPDYFSEEGQLWGNPLYRWKQMEKDGFGWWKKRMQYMLELFDGIRIDHFRAISAYWSVPAKETTAKNGKWIKGPGKKLIDAFRELENGKMILAEDLGIIDDATRELLAYSGYPGMAVFQFGFDGNVLSPHLPHNFPENLVAYTGTHDNNTLLGFLLELNEDTRKKVLDYLGDPKEGCEAAVRTLFMSRAATVIFPVQDLLFYGADTRINTPGNAAGNWRYRITKDQLDSVDWARFRHWNEIYGRI